MRVFGLNIPKVIQQRSTKELSREARQRLQVLDWYGAHGRNARWACRRFGISPDTFYRWKRRYQHLALASLESRSHRPQRRRQPTWAVELAVAVLQLRTENPRWGKAKLRRLLHAQGWAVCVSMVGRILTSLKATGQLAEGRAPGVTVLRRPVVRPYAMRKPKDYRPIQPGDLVQLDTLDLRPLPGVILKQFTARDVVSRWDVLTVGTQATAAAATRFLDDLRARSPFPHPSPPGRWWQRVHGRLRTGLPAARHPPFLCSHHAAPSSMAAWNGPTAPTPRNSGNVTTATWTWPAPGPPSWLGSTATTLIDPTRPWATLRPCSFSNNAIPQERSKVYGIYWTSTTFCPSAVRVVYLPSGTP